MKRQARSLSKNWYNKYSEEEIKQEELIQAWKSPDLIGYEGLLAYNQLFYNAYKETKSMIKTVKLKKNIPDDLTSGISSICSFNDELLDFVNQFDLALRARITILLQGCINEIYTGIESTSFRQLSSLTNISKSALQRLRSVMEKDLQSYQDPQDH